MKSSRKYRITAAERVKTIAAENLELLDLRSLRGFMDAKGFDLTIVAKLATFGFFGPLFGELVLRGIERRSSAAGLLNSYAVALRVIEAAKDDALYTGSDLQNSQIDMALANAGLSREARRFGEGAASFFDTGASIPDEIKSVSIAIIGYGAAGIMVASALRALGFSNIVAYEKSRSLGLWSNENVYGLSRNNPLRLRYFDLELDPAPGGGDEVRRFLRRLVTLRPQDMKVVRVKPGSLKHQLLLSNGERPEYSIVINAVGIGKPKPVSDPERMVTTSGLGHAGLRWQQQLSADQMVGKRVIMIGLGNSTAEMLRQIHSAIDAGYHVDYRVLTHYPVDSVHNPSAYVPHRGQTYRLFRDTSRPNLVDYQGDLAHSRYDYFRALHGGKIIAGVRRWEIDSPGVLSVFRGGKKPIDQLPFDKIMTLIGYRQPETTMRDMGCAYDAEGKCGIFDYDGEYAASPGRHQARRRVSRGCFGFGSVLETIRNPNAIVIPGMIHRVGDLLFGVIMRACEVRKKELMRL